MLPSTCPHAGIRRSCSRASSAPVAPGRHRSLRSCNASAFNGGVNGPNSASNGGQADEHLYTFPNSAPASTPSQDVASSSTAVPGVHPTVIMTRGEYQRPPVLPPGYDDRITKTASTSAIQGASGDSNLSRELEADKKLITTINNPAKTTGLRRAPLSGGVKTATDRWALPSPSVAVRNLVEQANFAHLCTVMSNMHHRRAGYPFGTLVDFASDGAGSPIFCLSPLAIHARNIIEDSRCSLVVQMPGWTGLANARVTIFGDIYRLPNDMQDDAREIFLKKHSTQRKERWVTGNFLYFRMHRIVDIYFVGGFGTVQWIDPKEYIACQPDQIVLNDPNLTLQVLNQTFAEDVRQLCYPGNPADDAAFISIDAAGVEIRVRHGADLTVERIGFATRINTREEAVAAVRGVLSQL